MSKGRIAPFYNMDREYENLVNEIRVEMGYSLKTLAKKCETHAAYMWRIAQGLESPLYTRSRKGAFIKPWAEKLAVALETPLEEIFPREICAIHRLELSDEDTAWLLLSRFTKVNAFNQIAQMIDLHKEVNKLDFRLGKILVMRFWWNWSQAECGRELGVSRERIRQIEQTALRELRYRYMSKPRTDFERRWKRHEANSYFDHSSFNMACRNVRS